MQIIENTFKNKFVVSTGRGFELHLSVFPFRAKITSPCPHNSLCVSEIFVHGNQVQPVDFSSVHVIPETEDTCVHCE